MTKCSSPPIVWIATETENSKGNLKDMREIKKNPVRSKARILRQYDVVFNTSQILFPLGNDSTEVHNFLNVMHLVFKGNSDHKHC